MFTAMLSLPNFWGGLGCCPQYSRHKIGLASSLKVNIQVLPAAKDVSVRKELPDIKPRRLDGTRGRFLFISHPEGDGVYVVFVM